MIDERDIETAASIARLETVLERIETKLDHVESVQQEQGLTLQSLVETRQRWRSATKWVAGVASAVIAALLVVVFGKASK